MRIKLSGFFTPEQLMMFRADRNAAQLQLECGPNEHITLCDMTDMKIQSQAMVQAFRAFLSDNRYKSKKLAFVMASSLARLQLLRVTEGRNARMFFNAVEAMEWLLEPDVNEQAA